MSENEEIKVPPKRGMKDMEESEMGKKVLEESKRQKELMNSPEMKRIMEEEKSRKQSELRVTSQDKYKIPNRNKENEEFQSRVLRELSEIRRILDRLVEDKK